MPQTKGYSVVSSRRKYQREETHLKGRLLEIQVSLSLTLSKNETIEHHI